jgi:hypothetical protein
MLRRTVLMTVAGMAWKNRAAIEQAVRGQSRRRSMGTARR